MAAPPIVTANKLTLLGLVQAACEELSITVPTSVVGATDNITTQLLALAKREAMEYYNYGHRLGGWQELRVQETFYTAGVTGINGNLTLGSNVITNVSSTTGLTVGWAVIASGIAADTHVTAINSVAQTVTVDSPATLTNTAVALTIGQDQYSLPNDFEALIVQTAWDRSFRWQLLGPLSAQEWQVLRSGLSPTGPRRRYRIMGNLIWIDPPPDGVYELAFEYYSQYWCQSAGGVAQPTWQADTDYYTLDDQAFIMGLKWRFLAAKKLDYTQEKADYDRKVERNMARNGGNRDLPTNAQASGLRLLNQQNVPDTGFGS